MPIERTTLLYKKINELAELPEIALEKLFSCAVLRQTVKGQIILKQGQVCKNIYFVEQGLLRTFIMKNGNEINTDFCFENNFTSNLKSLRLGTPSETSIQANEDSLIYCFDKDQLLSLYQASTEIESFGRKLLEQLLILQEEHTQLFKIYSPTERYQYLVKNRPGILQRVSLSQLSSYLGIARETLSRIRKK